MVRHLKMLKSSRLGRVQAFPMYGGLGMSAPSLHRESVDTLSLSNSHYNVLIFHEKYYVAQNPTFGFQSTESRVAENEGLVDVCVIQLSPGPFVAPITLQLTFNNNQGKKNYVVMVMVSYIL